MTSVSSLAPLLHRFQTGIGAWLIGTLLSTLLEGMLILQTIRYIRRGWSSDPVYLRLWVLAVVILQTVLVGFTIHTCYWYLVTNAFTVHVFAEGDLWSAALVPVVGSLSNLGSESFFARRVWILGARFRAVVVVAMVMILAACGFYIAVTAQAFELNNATTSANAGGWLPTAGSALMLAADVQLTAVLIYVLYGQRRDYTGSTNSMVDLIILYVISTGFLICVFNVIALGLSASASNNIIYTASLLVGNQVYSNSFLVALNTRTLIRNQGEKGISDADIAYVGPHKKELAIAPRATQLTSLVFQSSRPSETQLENDEWMLRSGPHDSDSDATKTMPLAPPGSDEGRATDVATAV